MDAMSLSAEASVLEMSLGPYWEPSDEENMEAAEVSGLQVCESKRTGGLPRCLGSRCVDHHANVWTKEDREQDNCVDQKGWGAYRGVWAAGLWFPVKVLQNIAEGGDWLSGREREGL
eukprot:1155618-Pelagomonas_calceolata.AAC.4